MKFSPGESSYAPTLADFLHLNEEIAALVRARTPLESQLTQIGGELPAKAGKLAEKIGHRLSAGESLPAAIESECAAMPAIYRVTMIAGLESGRLDSAIRSLVDTATRLDQMRRITGVALLYPMIIVTTAFLLFALIVTSVVPRFEWLNQSHFGVLARLSHFPLTIVAIAIIAPIVIALVAAIWWWRSGKVNGVVRQRFGILDWLPGVRQVRRWSHATTFAELLVLLIEGNIPLPEALRLTADATDDPQLREASRQLADRVQQGDLAQAEGEKQVDHAAQEFPLLIRLALFHSTNRALLVGGLRHAAALYRERAIRAAEWYAEYLPILLTVGLGGTLTMCFTLAVLWPYASTLYELARWK